MNGKSFSQTSKINKKSIIKIKYTLEVTAILIDITRRVARGAR